MKIEYSPNDYTPVEEGLCFGFSTESEEPTDVEVEVVNADTEEVVAVKLLRQVVSGEVNIAPYVERFSQREPQLVGEGGSSLSQLESVRYKIRIGEVESESVAVSPIRCGFSAPALLTTMPLRRKIFCDGCDELLFAVQDNTDVKVIITPNIGAVKSLSYKAVSGVMRLLFTPSELGQDAKRIYVQIKLNAQELCCVEYEVLQRRGRSLCVAWESECGSVERYIFPMTYALRNEVTKQRVGDGNNLNAVAITRSKIVRAMSNYEPRNVVAALSEIIASPKVWFEYDGRWHKVDVVTSEECYNLFGEPDFVELDLRVESRRVVL